MLIPNNPDIDFEELNSRIASRMADAPTVPQPVPLHTLLSLEDTAFVEQAYANYLLRLPTPEEMMEMLPALQQGHDKQALILRLLRSDEFSRRGVSIRSRRLRLKLLAARIPGLQKVTDILLAFAKVPGILKHTHALQNLLYRQQCEYRSAIHELQESNRELEDRNQQLQQQLHSLHATIVSSVDSALEDMHASVTNNQQTLERRIKALQLALSTTAQIPANKATALHAESPTDPAFYLAFEDRFRGSQSTIQERLRAYLPTLCAAALLQEDEHTIVDLGCGRGEWLSLLKQEGYNAIGIDLSPVNTALCQEQSLQAITADAIDWLSKQSDNSLSCITGFHIIEHLPFPVLRNLFEQAIRTLKPSGLLIVETPNPENLVTGATHFYTDPTHLRPLPPALTEFLAAYYGFENIEIRRLHPIPDEYQISENSEAARRCNQYFYSAQDYALIATCPLAHNNDAD
jgi:O-antigen chain-terminating methyltransferase